MVTRFKSDAQRRAVMIKLHSNGVNAGKIIRNPFKVGQKVTFLTGVSAGAVFTVYGVYSPRKVSLGLFNSPDVEQDYLVDINELVPVHKEHMS